MASAKPTCSFGTTCYRLNLDHFRQIAHPHLDQLLDNIPEDMPIVVPDQLKFPCSNRALLGQQLENLRTARKTKSDGPGTSRANVQGKSYEKAKKSESTRARALHMMRLCGQAQDYVPPQGKFAEKHRNAAPYYIFFTAVQKEKATWNQERSVTMSELLDKSLGKITLSLHLSFVIDVGWLCAQYMLAEQKMDMAVFYGQQADEEVPLPDTIKMHHIKCPNSFGCHHSKLSILQYEDSGIRIIVSTANLYSDDWNLRTQGLWMSPHLPRLPTTARSSDGESKTGFKQELLRYFSEYGREMDLWKAVVKRTDFSAVNVALVFSVPSRTNVHLPNHLWGQRRLRTILKKHVKIPEDQLRSTIIAQGSSMGNFGKEYNSWIGSELANSMAKTTGQDAIYNFKVIYPTIENYKRTYDMREAANCLCYTERGHNNQLWLEPHLHQWVANRTNRSSAVPHIKTFTSISSDESKMWWFILGSANLSKAAWGYRQGSNICVLNYETSVLFLPEFVTGTTSFPLKANCESAAPIFPIPYDLPLTPYGENDKPFVTEFFQKCDNVFSS